MTGWEGWSTGLLSGALVKRDSFEWQRKAARSYSEAAGPFDVALPHVLHDISPVSSSTEAGRHSLLLPLHVLLILRSHPLGH